MLRAALVCLALAGTVATADAQQDRQGYYVGIEMGALVGSPLGQLKFEDIGYQAVTVNLKYRF